MFSIKGNKSDYLKGKKITLCVTGSVAVVRVPEIARELMRHGAEVFPVMSEAANQLVGEALLEWACEKPVTKLTGKIEHVQLGAYNDLVLVCPCTANTLSKIAMGVDDTPVTSTVTCAIGAKKPVVAVPAMHESMYEHPIVAENVEKLLAIGVKVLNPRMEEDKAKIASNSEILEAVLQALLPHDLDKMKIVVTAGPTFERVDPVRGISNLSSGRMGIAVAKAARRRGAEVTLICGPTYEEVPRGTIRVESAAEMTRESLAALESADALVSAAAISDFSPEKSESKIDSSEDMVLHLKRNEKLVTLARKKFPKKLVVAFKLDDSDLLKKADAMAGAGLDLIVANHVSAIGSEENEVFIVRGKDVREVRGSKERVADEILSSLAKLYK